MINLDPSTAVLVVEGSRLHTLNTQECRENVGQQRSQDDTLNLGLGLIREPHTSQQWMTLLLTYNHSYLENWEIWELRRTSKHDKKQTMTNRKKSI